MADLEPEDDTDTGVETYENIANENTAELQQIDKFLSSKLMDQSFESEERPQLSIQVSSEEREVPAMPLESGDARPESEENCSLLTENSTVELERAHAMSSGSGGACQSAEEALMTSSNILDENCAQNQEKTQVTSSESGDTGQSLGETQVTSSNILSGTNDVQSLGPAADTAEGTLGQGDNSSSCPNIATLKDDESELHTRDKSNQSADLEEASSNILKDATQASEDAEIEAQSGGMQCNKSEQSIDLEEASLNILKDATQTRGDTEGGGFDDNLRRHYGEESGLNQDECKDQEPADCIESVTRDGIDYSSDHLEASHNVSGSSTDYRNSTQNLDEDANRTLHADESVTETAHKVSDSSTDYDNSIQELNEDADRTLHEDESVTETAHKVSDSSTDYHNSTQDDDGNRTLHADKSVTETANKEDDEEAKTPTPVQIGGSSSYIQPGSSVSSDMSLSFEYDRPRDYCVKTTLPNTQHCPVYALVLCSWDNILGPHAQYVWQTEGKHNFTIDIMNYLSTHTLTSSDQPENTVDTKMLILKDRGILVTSFLFSGYDKMEKTVFSLSLIVPYMDYQWYLPLHEFCVSRLSMMIGKLRVLQDKYKEEVGDRAVKAFNEDVPKFMDVLTQLKISSPGPRIQLSDTVFAGGLENTLDVQFTRLAIASHLQTCGCSIVLGNTVSEVNMMISSLAIFSSPAERRCCIYLTEGEPRIYEKDLYLQGFLKDTINLSECMREIMVSSYPSTLVDMVTLEVRQMLPYNEHAYWRHEVLCHELQSLWLDSKEPMVYLPIVTFQNRSETETLVQNFQREINLVHPHSGVREAYIEQYQRLLDRKAVGLIKYVEEETMRGSKTSRITIKKLKHDLDLNPEGNFRIILARAEKLKPGIYTIVCGNPAQMRDLSLQELPMT